MHRYWPLFDLEVRTPQLTLRYIDDDLAAELCDLMQQGIHASGFMPFAVPWSTVPSPQREHDALRHYWAMRGSLHPDRWTIEVAVVRDGSVIGAGGLMSENFPRLRTLETGSWLGLAHQGRGLGREFRHAMLHLAFAGLGAAVATTGAWSDNGPSLGVTRRLGYQPNGVFPGIQGDQPGELHRFRMPRSHWETIRRDDIELIGVAPVVGFLGLDG
jgi:RimJ/RimL family protein N-acetyltransferase